MSALLRHARAPTLPLREGRNLPFANFGEGHDAERASLAPPRIAALSDPPSRGGWILQDCSFFVLVLGLSSQNDHNAHYVRLPPRRASRGGFARAAQAARPPEGGGGGRILPRNYVAEAGRCAARQPQWLQTWPPLPRNAGAEGRDPSGARQTAQSLRGDRRHAQTGRRSERTHGRFAGRRPVAGRLERRLFLGEGGGR